MAFGQADVGARVFGSLSDVDLTDDVVRHQKREKVGYNVGSITVSFVRVGSSRDLAHTDGTVTELMAVRVFQDGEAFVMRAFARPVASGEGQEAPATLLIVRRSIGGSKTLLDWDVTGVALPTRGVEAMTSKEQVAVFSFAAAGIALVALGAFQNSLAIATAGIGLMVTLAVGLLELRVHA